MIIEIEKGKKYAARFRYTDCFGKQHRPYKGGFPSRKAAMLWEQQEKAKLEGSVVSSETMNYGKLYKEWFSALVKKPASPKTLEKYERYHSYIAEYIDHLPLRKIDERVCQKIIDMNLASPSNCVEIRKLLSASFNYARKKRWMKENPTDFVDMPSYRPKKIEAYNFDDIQLLFELLKSQNSKLYSPILCACFFAATREEVCALQETDITKTKDGKYRVCLDKAMITVKGRTIIKGQKTENRRRVFIFSESLYNEIHSFKTENGILSPFVCCNRNGKNIQPNTVSNTFARFLQQNGLKPTTFHKLRDAFANACKRLGVDLDTTFRMMGHASYKTTAEHYATADEVLIDDAVTRIENALFN